MVDPKIIKQQLQKIKFGNGPWNQPEISELPHIIHENEKISECVNGFYEGGVALLVATENRVLLIDKKPLRFLNVEDLRFDMINEIDYSHRLFGATITISTGSKTLKFQSFNQNRLRNLIGLVQEHMTQGKKEQLEKATNQQQHLEEINRQLQVYLMAQHQQLQQLQVSQSSLSLPKPSPQLSDYLFAQQLMQQVSPEVASQLSNSQPAAQQSVPTAPADGEEVVAPVNPSELVADARQEIFGSKQQQQVAQTSSSSSSSSSNGLNAILQKGLEINPLSIAYAKLPMLLRSRKFDQAKQQYRNRRVAGAAS